MHAARWRGGKRHRAPPVACIPQRGNAAASISTTPAKLREAAISARIRAAVRYAPLLACLTLALALFWWQPSRLVSALLVAGAYVAVCLHQWRGFRKHMQPSLALTSDDALVIAYASQGGQARELAERSAEQLGESGMLVDVRALNALDPAALVKPRRALLILSTYGESEAPDNAARFERRLLEENIDLSSLSFAVLALGDRQYSHFCGFGQRIDARLQALGAQPMFDRLEADRVDPGVLRHWQHQLAQLSGNSLFTDWLPPPYQPWRLTARRCLNPGSSGAAVHLLSLAAPSGEARWRAGDIVEVGPRHALARVETVVRELELDPYTLIEGQSLAAHLSRRYLPEPRQLQGCDVNALLDLPLLPHREYSIASIPADDTLQLLVRETSHPDGTPGLGSGWLCRYADVGERIDLRIRNNPSFHGPDADTPLILIGNGTGIAGLRAHLRERAAMRSSRNWLLFGERNAAHDSYFHDELEHWQQSGHLRRLDLVFSRDQAEKRYVQHALRDAADDLRQWVEQGAAIYVCGSLEGMGRDVQQILIGLLGQTQVEQLSEQGRYRRDLY